MNKRKLLILGALVLVIICYTTYVTRNTQNFSQLALSNIEALADDAEIDGTNCSAIMEKKCCVCFHLHHTFAKPIIETDNCKLRTGCSHYN